MKTINIFKFALITLLICMSSVPAEAQILKKLLKKAENVVEKGVDNITKKKQEKNTTHVPNSIPEEQLENEEEPPPVSVFELSDYLTRVDAPNKAFKPMHFQMHNGLRRVGLLSNFRQKAGKDGFSREQAYKLSELLSVESASHELLLKIRFLHPHFAMLDNNVIYEMPRNKGEIDNESIYRQAAQQTLARAASNILTDQYKNLFLVNNLPGANKTPQPWGGVGANEFAQRKAYNSFMTSYKDDLLVYAGNLFKNNTEQFYVVAKTILKDYDFNQKGYWVHIGINGHYRNNLSTIEGFYSQFEPTTDYGNDYLNKLVVYSRKNGNSNGGLPILLKITEKEAEQLIGNKKSLIVYYAVKTKVTYTGLNVLQPSPKPQYTYSLLSPKITFYTDDLLQNAVGTISLENMIIKSKN